MIVRADAGTAGSGSDGSGSGGEGLQGPVAEGPVAEGPAAEGPLYPVGLVLRGRRCLVVGGGPVAARKVRTLVECGAEVTMVATDASAALRILRDDRTLREPVAGSVDVRVRPYEAGEAASYRFVIAATGVPDVDRAVYVDAEAAGVWVNSADDPAHCSVMLPAVWRTGAVTVAVSTGGTSPALAGWLRTRVARMVGAHLGQLATLLGRARATLRAEGRPTDCVDWRQLLDGPLTAIVADGRMDDAAALVEQATGPRRTNAPTW